ncbi:AI-2E family transporter [soil metagenome]
MSIAGELDPISNLTVSADPNSSPAEASARRWNERANLATVAVCLVIAFTSWHLLKEFAALFRPLLLAIFLCYIILPTHHRLTNHISRIASMILLAGLSVGLLVLMALQVTGSATKLSAEMPHLTERAQAIFRSVEKFTVDRLPPWLSSEAKDSADGQSVAINHLKQIATSMAGAAADTLADAVLVGIYLIFFLMEAGRVPRRIQSAFTGTRPDRILHVLGNINVAMAGYLRVKVKVNLALALPVTIVLWSFGVEFALMWGLLTFFLNFIPYLGSVIACSCPIVLAYLQMNALATPTVVAVLLVTIHMTSAYVVEPALTGKAVGLSPVVILVSLSFWGLCWGITGMLLAVPLTVMAKIVMENIAFTRPLAILMSED